MALAKERVYFLLDAYITKRATTEQTNELMNWILETGEDSDLRSYVLATWKEKHSVEDLSYVDWDSIYARVMETPVVPFQSRKKNIPWFKLTAAAIVIVSLTAAYFYSNPTKVQQVVHVKQIQQKDIAPPSGNNAVLTLSNGTTIGLDSSSNGTIALQGNVRIIKQTNGEIIYEGMAESEVNYNTLHVPKGSKPFMLMLSDGSQVWLNVGSSLTYPTAFSGKERKVKITGEAYFEVAHRDGIPFKVQHDNVSVNVLGTHFNMNSYEDENEERITLLEGSVLISKNKSSKLLKPGQQASIISTESSDIKILNDVNIEEVMAWKNGKFRFGENSDIAAVMRQISRWYNVDIEYKGTVSQRFWGTISKNVNVSNVLKILEATGGVKFKVEEKKIIVMPASL